MKTLPNSTLRKINALFSETDSVYHEAARKVGLTDSALSVLYMSYDNGGKRELKDITSSGISKQTLNSALRKLEAEGTIYLEGKKEKTVRLTEEGMKTAERTVGRIIDIENSIFDDWTDEEISMYLNLTQKYLDKLKEKVKEL